MPSREMPVAEAVRALDLVAYQEGAIVSRTLLRRGAGSITLFAFDQGQALSEHTTASDAVVDVLEGEADIVVSGQRQQVSAGEMIFMPAHQPHALSARTRFKMLLTMIQST